MRNVECRMTNDGFASLSLFKQTEYIIRCSMLDVRCSTFISFFSLIRLAVFLARGRARVKLHLKRTAEFRTRNIE
ncbi:hypothetical protein D1AOALGA4SA_3239 [Olavius algarvensis Delta 1 endosymbiont]|nr:hypothetical protein D1AOALGA4SA_3239 [Olavius algarvensis Delta 1 endosymbiont]